MTNVVNFYLLFELTDAPLQIMDLFMKLVVLFLKVKDGERDIIWVLIKSICIEICRICWGQRLDRGWG